MKSLKFFFLFVVLLQTAVSGQETGNQKAPKFTIYTSAFDYFPNQLNSANFNVGLERPFRKNQRQMYI